MTENIYCIQIKIGERNSESRLEFSEAFRRRPHKRTIASWYESQLSVVRSRSLMKLGSLLVYSINLRYKLVMLNTFLNRRVLSIIRTLVVLEFIVEPRDVQEYRPKRSVTPLLVTSIPAPFFRRFRIQFSTKLNAFELPAYLAIGMIRSWISYTFTHNGVWSTWAFWFDVCVDCFFLMWSPAR